MAARATSSGTISFGLVSIPVKVYPATRSKSVHFNMLHAKDQSRLKQQYVCAADGEVVERDDTVRGYEYARDQYVVFTEAELKALETKSDKSIEIEHFVPIEKVDPVYFEKSQLLGPDKGGQKAYRLLNEAMLTMGRVAVGRYRTRGREQLVLIRPVGRGLMLHGLFYADEVGSFEDVEFGDEVQVRAGELQLAQQLIEQLAQEKFDPKQFEDRYRQAVLAAAEQKIAGQEVVVAEKPESREQIIDLVAALKRSLEERRGAASEAGAPGGGRMRKPALAKGKDKDAATGRKRTAREVPPSEGTRAMDRPLSTAEVSRLLGLEERHIREWARSGLCRPVRHGRRYAFSFQDLVALRAAKALLEASVPAARIRRAIAALVRELPEERPLSGLRIFADGRDVAVCHEGASWQPVTGQALLDFEVDRLAELVEQARKLPAPAGEADDALRAREAFEAGLGLEDRDVAAAQAAYRRALAVDPDLVDAYINLGRLAHEAGDAREAARLYRLALERSPEDPVLHFNLALSVEDTRGPAAAIEHYERALVLDPDFADAHYNVAGLYEQQGRGADALRHYRAYKQLTEG